MNNVNQVNKKFKKKKEKKETNPDAAKRNLKAFAIKSAVKSERQFRRKQDIIAKRERAPQVDRTPLEPPPAVIAVVGPPKVGKTTLIRSLIRNYTKEKINQINGPVTVISSKKHRLTFIECNNDINCMIDVAKVADLVLLMVDASFGFEMETFEFLNICQSHGFPRIMGVLSHLDVITNPKKLKNTKKQLKHRFWTEIYAGAKLFYLSKFVHNEYLRNEIHNLARFISVMKFRPLQWSSNHPYMLVDRIEDLTNQEDIRKNEKCNRKVCLFGYSRGANFKPNQEVHIPGCGDFTIDKINFIPDPCPLPNKEVKQKRRSLNEKEKCIYAPMSGVGGIVYDNDAVYIDLGGSHLHEEKDFSKQSSEDKLVASLNLEEHLDEKIKSSEIKLFSNTMPISYNDSEIFIENKDKRIRRQVVFENADDNDDEVDDVDSENSDDSEDNSEEEESGIPNMDDDQSVEEDVEFYSSEDGDDDVSDDNDSNEMKNNWKNNLQLKASEAFYERISRVDNIQKLVYGNFTLSENEIDTDGQNDVTDDLFTVLKENKENQLKMKFTLNSIECSKFPNELLIDFSNQKRLKFIRDCFVTGKWSKKEDAATMLDKDEKARKAVDDIDDDDEELYDDFEDFETGEVFEADKDTNGKNEESQVDSNLEDNDEDDGDEDLLKKKMKKKEMFNEEYDNLKSSDVINPTEKTFLDLEKEKLQRQSEVC